MVRFRNIIYFTLILLTIISSGCSEKNNNNDEISQEVIITSVNVSNDGIFIKGNNVYYREKMSADNISWRLIPNASGNDLKILYYLSLNTWAYDDDNIYYHVFKSAGYHNPNHIGKLFIFTGINTSDVTYDTTHNFVLAGDALIYFGNILRKINTCCIEKLSGNFYSDGINLIYVQPGKNTAGSVLLIIPNASNFRIINNYLIATDTDVYFQGKMMSYIDSHTFRQSNFSEYLFMDDYGAYGFRELYGAVYLEQIFGMNPKNKTEIISNYCIKNSGKYFKFELPYYPVEEIVNSELINYYCYPDN